MNNCKDKGCQNLSWKCDDCGRTKATVKVAYGDWISVKDKAPPPLETVILADKGQVIVGWNASICPEEDPVYYAYESDHDFSVSHWIPLPKPPKESCD